MLAFSDQCYQLVEQGPVGLMRPMIVYDSISISRQLLPNTYFQVCVVMYIFRYFTCTTENTAVNNYLLPLLQSFIVAS